MIKQNPEVEESYISPVDIRERKITIESEIPYIEVQFRDEQYLERRLNDLNFWEGEKRIYETHSSIYDNIYELRIVITDKEQSKNRIVSTSDGKKQVSYSTGLVYDIDAQRLNVYLHINSKLLDELDIAEKALSYNLLRRLYGVKNSVGESEDYSYMRENGSEPFIRLVRLR